MVRRWRQRHHHHSRGRDDDLGGEVVGDVGDALLAGRAVMVHVLEPAQAAGQAGDAGAEEADGDAREAGAPSRG